MEVSQKCLSLLNSQDGGILTVSFPQANPETASFVVLILFCSVATMPLSFLWLSEAWVRHTPQNNAHKHRNTEFAYRSRGFGDPAPHSAHLWMPWDLGTPVQNLFLKVWSFTADTRSSIWFVPYQTILVWLGQAKWFYLESFLHSQKKLGTYFKASDSGVCTQWF